jgi:hypothetical protein
MQGSCIRTDSDARITPSIGQLRAWRTGKQQIGPSHMEEAVQKRVTCEAAAIALMKEKTSIIKRPLNEDGDKVIALGLKKRNTRRCSSKHSADSKQLVTANLDTHNLTL